VYREPLYHESKREDFIFRSFKVLAGLTRLTWTFRPDLPEERKSHEKNRQQDMEHSTYQTAVIHVTAEIYERRFLIKSY
jgi:hypothetical protein